MPVTTSIIVGNLSTTSPYVDSFVVEVYSNSGLTTLVGSGFSPSISNGSGGSKQSQAIVVSNLIYGSTYWSRPGVLAPTHPPPYGPARIHSLQGLQLLLLESPTPRH